MTSAVRIVYVAIAFAFLGVSVYWFFVRRTLRDRGVQVTGTIVKHKATDQGLDTFWVEFPAAGRVVTRKLTARDRDLAVKLVYDPEQPTRSLRADLLDSGTYTFLLSFGVAASVLFLVLSVTLVP